MLRSLADNLWVIDHPFKVGGLWLGTRTTIVRLASDGLWLHSPGPLTPDLVTSLTALGSVQALVAPNAMHHLYLAENRRAFPQAVVYLAPGLHTKLTEHWPHEILDDEAPLLWRNDLAQHLVGGLPKLNEVVFCHSASRTLILTDLSFNIRNSPSWFTRLFMRVNGGYNRFGPTRIFRTLVKDRAALRAALDQIQVWDFERVIVAHGEVLAHDGKREIELQFAWV